MLRYGAPPLGLGCGRVLCVVIGSRQTGPLSHTVVILVPYDWAVPGRDWALECFVVAAFSRLLVWLFFRLPRLPSHFAGLRCPSPSRVAQWEEIEKLPLVLHYQLSNSELAQQFLYYFLFGRYSQ